MKRLEAPEGYYYTQAGVIDPRYRVFATVLKLGRYDDEKNWRLADEAEKVALEAEAAALDDNPENTE